MPGLVSSSKLGIGLPCRIRAAFHIFNWHVADFGGEHAESGERGEPTAYIRGCFDMKRKLARFGAGREWGSGIGNGDEMGR